MPLTYQFEAGKGLASLRAAETERRELQPHDVRIAVRAVSLNYREILICHGHYPAPQDRPIVPCSDGAGTVVEVGDAAREMFSVGDDVVGAFFPDWNDGPSTPEKVAVSTGCNVDGWLAEEVVMDCRTLVRLPRGVTHTTAACAPCAGVTAWVSMVEAAKLVAGAIVLIQGTGGVAMWAACLAHARGIKAIILTSEDKKGALLQPDASLRVTYVDHPEWSASVLKATGGRGADLIIELGGKSTIRESLRSLAFGGHVAAIGGLGGWIYESVEPLQLITKMATVHGMYVGSTRSLRELLSFVAEHKIEPHVSARVQLREAPAAFRMLEAGGQHVGKIVIDVA